MSDYSLKVDTDAITQSLVDHFTRDSSAEASAAKAAESADRARGSSLRTLAGYLAGINQPLGDETIAAIAQSVGERCAKGAPNPDSILKVRKSEAKLLIEQRSELPGIIQGLDELNKTLERPVNLRHKTLQAARMIRSKAPTHAAVTSAQGAVEAIAEAAGPKAPKSPEEALLNRLEALKKHKLLKGKPGVEEAVAALEAAMQADESKPREDTTTAVMDTLVPETDSDEIEAVEPEIEAELEIEPDLEVTRVQEVDDSDAEMVDPDELGDMFGFGEEEYT